MSHSFKDRCAEWEKKVRRGNGTQVRVELSHLNLARLPSTSWVTVANLAWRCGAAELGARLLNPLVRPPPGGVLQASAEQRAEYAHCLTRLGALEESEDLLDNLTSDDAPRSLFYRGALCMVRWDYASALPLLKRYTELPQLTEYQRLVGLTNLAACLVYERKDRLATYLLGDLIHRTGVRKLELLYGNLLELSAQHLIQKRQYTKAVKVLNDAAGTLKHASGWDPFFVEKWRILLSFFQKPRESIDRLHALQKGAGDLGHWETVRDCDRFQAVCLSDRRVLWRVYFGTPYPAFRSRVLSDFGQSPVPPETPRWDFVSADGAWLNVETGKTSCTGIFLKPGQNLHRLLQAFASDLYKPHWMASLHQAIFPGDYFNPESGPARVHRCLVRFRAWLKEADFPLSVVERMGTYRLLPRGPVSLLLLREPKRKDRGALSLSHLKTRWPNSPFSLKDAAAELGVSYRTMARIAEMALKEGALLRVGRTSGARYQFPNSQQENKIN